MNPALYSFLSIDLAALLTAVFATTSCALVGNFLVLKKQSLMGDVISHTVLLGIVLGFLLFGTRAALPMFAGALFIGVLTVILVQVLRSLGRLDSGAAMGVVLSVLFALGILLLEQAAARNIELDADCILHGQLETIFWFPPKELAELVSFSTLLLLPFETKLSFFVLLMLSAIVTLFYKELRITSFDPQHASAIGIPANIFSTAVVSLVAIVVVASFHAVGSILVIAALICPAAIARFYTDRYNTQILLSTVIGLGTTLLGYTFAVWGPELVDWPHSLSLSGSIAVTQGAALFATAFLAPHYGVIGRWLRRLNLQIRILREDILGILFRVEELRAEEKTTKTLHVAEVLELLQSRFVGPLALRSAVYRNLVTITPSGINLSAKGQKRAAELVRSHRLWELYLVDKLGLDPDHVHDSAEQLEHFSDKSVLSHLEESAEGGAQDPHGKQLPKKEE